MESLDKLWFAMSIFFTSGTAASGVMTLVMISNLEIGKSILSFLIFVFCVFMFSISFLKTFKYRPGE